MIFLKNIFVKKRVYNRCKNSLSKSMKNFNRAKISIISKIILSCLNYLGDNLKIID